MFILRGFLAVSISLAFAPSIFSAPNRPLVPRGPGRNPGIEGTVAHVHHDPSNPGAGWIRIHRGLHSGRGQSMTFSVNAATRFERVGQRSRGNSLATFRALHRGERVRVLAGPGSNGNARVVEILSSSSHRSRNRFVSGYHHRSYYGRRHIYRRALPMQRRVAMPVRQNIKPIVKNEVRHRKPVQPKRTPSSGRAHPSSRHRK